MSALARLWAALTGAQARRVSAPPPAPAPALAPSLGGWVPAGAAGGSSGPPPNTGSGVQPPALPHVVIAPDLGAMLRATGWTDPAGWAAALAPACRAHGITQRGHLAALVATCTVETSGGRLLVESLNYDYPRLRAKFGPHRISDADAARLARVGPAANPSRPADQRGIANLLYGGEFGRRELGNTEPGDGWRFRGRGLIQVTGRRNYTRLAGELGMELDALTRAMETRDGAAETACRWWAGRGINRVVDGGDLEAVRRAVNGGANGLEGFRAAYAQAMNV